MYSIKLLFCISTDVLYFIVVKSVRVFHADCKICFRGSLVVFCQFTTVFVLNPSISH